MFLKKISQKTGVWMKNGSHVFNCTLFASCNRTVYEAEEATFFKSDWGCGKNLDREMFSGPPLKQGVSYNFWTQSRVRKKRVFFHFDRVRYPPPMPVTLQKLKIVHNQRLATLTEFLAFSAKLRIQTPESWFSSEKDLFSDSECVSNTPQQFTQIPLRQRLLELLNKRFSFYQKLEGEK